MARKHHEPEEIVGKLRQVEVWTGPGKPVADAVRGEVEKSVVLVNEQLDDYIFT